MCYDTIADVVSIYSFEVVNLPRKLKNIDVDNLTSSYLGGTSEKALAESFGISRSAIRRILVKNDIVPRGRSESMFVRMSQTSPQERQRLAQAAHKARTGQPVSVATKEKHALTVEKKGLTISKTEILLKNSLLGYGIETISQKAIGIYNVDLATDSVAMEVLGGSWHNTKSHGQRLNYLLDRGWDVIFVWIGKDFPLTICATQDIIAQIEFRNSHPTAPRRYRVIRGSGELVSVGQLNLDNIPDKIPRHSRTYPTVVETGLCHCGCGGRTKLVTTPKVGYVIGQPLRYISGHNNSSRSN